MASVRFVAAAGLLTAGLVPLSPPAQAAGTASLSMLGVPYRQDFDTLAASGLANTTLPPGWAVAETGTNADGAYAAGTGSSTTGNTWSFGAPSSTDRALGTLRSGALVPVIGVGLANDTGSTLDALDVAYTGEQWRVGTAGRLDRLDVQVSTDATGLTDGTWTDVDALDLASPASTVAGATTGAKDGNAAAQRTTVAGSATGLALAPGATVWLRWVDADASGADDGLALDDLTVTPRAGQAPPPAPACGDPVTPVHDVQGSGASSPLAGSIVQVEGVVVGDLQSGGFAGFFLQDEDTDADADPATSEGVFVSGGALADVAEGDRVRLTGTVTEFQGLTELTSVRDLRVCATGRGADVTASPLTLPLDDVGRESLEGMLVGSGQRLTVTEVYTLARYGEVSLASGGRLATPTAVVAPGADAAALQAANDRRRILLDDGRSTQNPDPVAYPQGGLSAQRTLRVGDTTASLHGVLDQRFGDYRVQPVGGAPDGATGGIVFDPTNARTSAPAAVGGDLRVGSFNVLNLFNGQPEGDFTDPANRGADSAAEYDRQLAKEVAAITALDADVLGLMELENDPTDGTGGRSSEQALVDALDAATAPGTYAFVDTGVLGGDSIRVGLLYQPAQVAPVGTPAVLDSTVDPRFDDTRNRPSLAQTFALAGHPDGDLVTVVVNHLKSKGSSCADLADPDTGDGQGNCNLTRTRAARALADWVAGDPTASGDPDALLVGDFNAYAQEDPITALRDAGYVDTVAAHVGAGAYSYVFDGQSGYLDHALASPSLAAAVTGVTEWHINADEPVALDYNTEFESAGQQASFYSPDPFRASDHDPVLVGLDLNTAPTVSAPAQVAVRNNGAVGLTASGSDADGGPLAYAWDLDGDGVFETPGRSVLFDAQGLHHTVRTVRVRVDDGSLSEVAAVQVVVGKPRL